MVHRCDVSDFLGQMNPRDDISAPSLVVVVEPRNELLEVPNFWFAVRGYAVPPPTHLARMQRLGQSARRPEPSRGGQGSSPLPVCVCSMLDPTLSDGLALGVEPIDDSVGATPSHEVS